MDRPERPGDGHADEIEAIVERARRLTEGEIVRLARDYDTTGTEGGVDRRRVLAIARRRAAREAELRSLEATVMEALAAAVRGPARRRLLQLGILPSAEAAVIDAVLAVALAERLGGDVARTLRAPWDAVA